MTTGQVIFYSGVGLLVFTIVLGIAFWLKKPQYIPENAVYDGGAEKRTRKLRSGYPTDRLTIRQESEQPIMSGTAVLQESTAQLGTEQSDTLPDTAVLPSAKLSKVQQTEKLSVGTVQLAGGTAPLTHDEDTAQLHDCPPASDGKTAVLDPSMQSEDTMELSGTTPLSGSQGE